MTHQPRPSFKSPRFAQPATFMRLRHLVDPQGPDVAIVGVPFDGRRFIQVAIRGPMYGEDDFAFHREHGITMIDIERVKERGVAWAIEQIQRVIHGPAYLTFDTDSVDPAFAPRTGTPEGGGLTSHEAQQLVRGLAGCRSSAATSWKSRRPSTVRGRSPRSSRRT